MLRMIEATGDDLERIHQFYKDCMDDLDQKGIFQWNPSYPNMETFKTEVANRTQFLFLDDENNLIGSVILNKYQSPEWSSVDWHEGDALPLVIHALAIHPEAQGLGFGQMALDLCHEYAIKKSCNLIRLDVFSENQNAINMYKKNQYKKRGEVKFSFKPEGHQVYYCYEKYLKKD